MPYFYRAIYHHALHAFHANATANATLRVIAAALADDHRRIHGQVRLDGECFDIHGAFGIPIALDRRGWIQRPMDILSISSVEKAMIEDSARSIRHFLDEVTAKRRKQLSQLHSYLLHSRPLANEFMQGRVVDRSA